MKKKGESILLDVTAIVDCPYCDFTFDLFHHAKFENKALQLITKTFRKDKPFKLKKVVSCPDCGESIALDNLYHDDVESVCCESQAIA